eukprot:COSAG02_NODE_3835_length_6173_cov_2.602898_2_plen_347_part_00
MTKVPELLLLLLVTVGDEAQAQPACTQGADCGGQVFRQWGTACPLVCGQPAREMCTEACVQEHQCPDGQCFNEQTGVCSAADEPPEPQEPADAVWCPESPPQICHMECLERAPCRSGQCHMRSDSCCSSTCQDASTTRSSSTEHVRSTCTADSDCPESTDDSCGYNCVDGECAMWCASGPEPPQTEADTIESTTIVRASLSLDGELEAVAGAEGSPARRQFEADFATDVAELVRIDSQRVAIASIVSGSVVVTFDIMPDGEDNGLEVSTVEGVFAAAGVSLPTLGLTTAAPATGVTAATPTATDVETRNLDASPRPMIFEARQSGVASVVATTTCGVAFAVASVIL